MLQVQPSTGTTKSLADLKAASASSAPKQATETISNSVVQHWCSIPEAVFFFSYLAILQVSVPSSGIALEATHLLRRTEGRIRQKMRVGGRHVHRRSRWNVHAASPAVGRLARPYDWRSRGKALLAGGSDVNDDEVHVVADDSTRRPGSVSVVAREPVDVAWRRIDVIQGVATATRERVCVCVCVCTCVCACTFPRRTRRGKKRERRKRGLHRESPRSSVRRDRSRRHPCRFWVRHSTALARSLALACSFSQSLPFSVARTSVPSATILRIRSEKTPPVARLPEGPRAEKAVSKMRTNSLDHAAVITHTNGSASLMQLPGSRESSCQAMPRASWGSHSAASVEGTVNTVHDSLPLLHVRRSIDKVGKWSIKLVQKAYYIFLRRDKIKSNYICIYMKLNICIK